MAKAIIGYSLYSKDPILVFDSDYDQINAQLLDKNSEIHSFRPDVILIYMSVEKLYENWNFCKDSDRINFAENIFEKIQMYWTIIHHDFSAKTIQFLYLEDDDMIFGNYGLKIKDSFYYQLKKLNYKIIENCANDVFLIDLNTIRANLGASIFNDQKMYYMAKITISLTALPYVAKVVVDSINAIYGKIKKCVILDLDNTLWGGVVGDDGLEGIQIGELGSGHAFTDFQKWLKELKNRGVILAVCSKNNEEIAKSVFLHHPEMVLRLEDIAIFVANWKDKATNIKYIQQRLNIGMDSIIFLDDNPFERNLVRELIQDITVPELPEEPEYYVKYLKKINLFETASYSDEDKGRTKQYQSEEHRKELEDQFEDYCDYLNNLEMISTYSSFDSFHFARIAQLTQRSNQFNLRTVRYTEDEIRELSQNSNYITLYFTLKDRFGDHGLISVVILEKCADNILFISEWLMSCRVLKRGMEEFIINTIIEIAKSEGYHNVKGEYIPTSKNKMVADIYLKEGFSKIEENTFIINVDSFEPKNTFIKGEKQ